MPMSAIASMSVATPIKPLSPHADVIALLSSADPEPALEQGVARLSRGGDLSLLLALASAMMRCDLAPLAEALLRSTGPAIEKHPIVQQILTQISGKPIREIARNDLFQRYRANATAIESRRPDLKPALDGGPPSAMRFIKSRAGNVHVLRENTSPRFTTVFPFVHHTAHAAAAKLPDATLQTSMCLIGVPSMPLFARLWEQNVAGYRPAIDIIETDREALRAWVCLIDGAEMLADRRLNLFVGNHALDDYAAWLDSNPARLPPAIVLTNHRAGWTPLRIDDAWRKAVETRAAARRSRIKCEVEARLAHRSDDEWAARFDQALRRELRLNIVGFTNRNSTVVQHAMRDLAAAFERLGHSFEVVAQPDDCSPNVDVAGALAANDRDMIVAINHLRFEYADTMPANLPYVGWIQDHVDHLWKRDAGVSITERDLIIAHAPDVLTGLYGYPRDRMLASSNLTDAHTYSAERLPEAELKSYRCDVSFVSHGASTPEQLCDEIERVTTPAFGRMLRVFLALARERMTSKGCLTAQRLVELMLEAERESGHPPLSPEVRRANVYPQIARIHDRLFRHETLAWAANWARSRGRSLRIYGRGWQSHPSLAAFAAGEVESGRRLRSVYQASSVNLQANAYSSLHQRLLDGVASGGLVISRFNPADFVRHPFITIQQAIQTRGIASLEALMTERDRDAVLAKAIIEAERLSGAVIAAGDDPRRKAQIEIFRQANDIAELQTDAGLFAMLRDLRFIPARVASDLPGFAQTCFATESEMRVMLDRFVDDERERVSISTPMRDAVLAHDTFDALAKRILASFAGRAVSCAG